MTQGSFNVPITVRKNIQAQQSNKTHEDSLFINIQPTDDMSIEEPKVMSDDENPNTILVQKVSDNLQATTVDNQKDTLEHNDFQANNIVPTIHLPTIKTTGISQDIILA